MIAGNYEGSTMTVGSMNTLIECLSESQWYQEGGLDSVTFFKVNLVGEGSLSSGLDQLEQHALNASHVHIWANPGLTTELKQDLLDFATAALVESSNVTFFSISDTWWTPEQTQQALDALLESNSLQILDEVILSSGSFVTQESVESIAEFVDAAEGLSHLNCYYQDHERCICIDIDWVEGDSGAGTITMQHIDTFTRMEVVYTQQIDRPAVRISD